MKATTSEHVYAEDVVLLLCFCHASFRVYTYILNTCIYYIVIGIYTCL